MDGQTPSEQVGSEIQAHWTFREELTIEDSIVLKGTQILVPHKECEATLKLIHERHLRPWKMQTKS